MKKLMALIGTMVLSSACLATNSFVYCPEKITCTVKGDINSCTVSDNAEHWGAIINSGEVEAAVYSEMMPPQYYSQKASCGYSYTHGKTTKGIGVYAKIDGLKPYVDDTNGWYVYGDNFICRPSSYSDRSLCPFQSS